MCMDVMWMGLRGADGLPKTIFHFQAWEMSVYPENEFGSRGGGGNAGGCQKGSLGSGEQH